MFKKGHKVFGGFQKGNQINKGRISGMKGKKHSKETKEKLSLSHKGMHNSPKTEFKKGMIPYNKGLQGIRIGEKASHWKGGIRNNNGYVMVYSPNHPFATINGYVRRSHLVMEKKIGRFIKPEEVVHHINNIKNDDRPENLKLFPNKSKHAKFHKNHSCTVINP